jgi:hypothetical protein
MLRRDTFRWFVCRWSWIRVGKRLPRINRRRSLPYTISVPTAQCRDSRGPPRGSGPTVHGSGPSSPESGGGWDEKDSHALTMRENGGFLVPRNGGFDQPVPPSKGRESNSAGEMMCPAAQGPPET